MLSQFKKIEEYKEKHESKIIKWPKLNKQYSSKNKGDQGATGDVLLA